MDAPEPSALDAAKARRVRVTAIACASFAVGMVGLAFAAVPLYDLFCKATGYGGTPKIYAGPSTSTADRVVTVRFDANVAPGIAWRFSPEATQVEAKLGETKTVFYRLTNT